MLADRHQILKVKIAAIDFEPAIERQITAAHQPRFVRDVSLPIDRIGAKLFFQLISQRYERGPMVMTSNQSFDE